MSHHRWSLIIVNKAARALFNIFETCERGERFIKRRCESFPTNDRLLVCIIITFSFRLVRGGVSFIEARKTVENNVIYWQMKRMS